MSRSVLLRVSAGGLMGCRGTSGLVARHGVFHGFSAWVGDPIPCVGFDFAAAAHLLLNTQGDARSTVP